MKTIELEYTLKKEEKSQHLNGYWNERRKL